ncbi:MAG: hypothetical protein JO113_03535 [Candidatus Eremiobacteraeota bacterium]|nr:hypothetical protein [Candidatus Eremiobacteraeota bacterium]
MNVETALLRSVFFVAFVALTSVLAYFYQRHERKQRLAAAWMWPAFYSLLAARSVVMQLPGDSALGAWLGIAFPVGLTIGAARGLAFKVFAAQEPHTMRLMATPLSAAIYLVVLFYNEFIQVFRHGDPQLGRLSCALLVVTAGSSIAVNAVRIIRYASIARRV